MTNGDKIRMMTDEQLSYVIQCPYIGEPDICDPDGDCFSCTKKWLESEAGE